MKPPASARPDQAMFWREPAFAGAELLKAEYWPGTVSGAVCSDDRSHGNLGR